MTVTAIQLSIVKLLLIWSAYQQPVLSLKDMIFNLLLLAQFSDTLVYANNSVIDIELIGEGFEGDQITNGGALECHTGDTNCCRPTDGMAGGEWYDPDGNVVIAGNQIGSANRLYRTRDHMVVRLNIRGFIPMAGLYRCEIPGAGRITITRYITLTSGEGLCADLPSLANGDITYTPLRMLSSTLPDGQRYQGTIATYSCSSGYQLVQGSTQRACVGGNWNGTQPLCEFTFCPTGEYVQELSTGEIACVACPANSISIVAGSRECTCFNGYYRTTLEGPNTPCSTPPSSCQNLQVFEERTRGNTITVRWNRPEITGREDFYYNVFYSEDNQTFTQHNFEPYIKQDSLVDYSLSGLRPLTTFSIRVTAENGVSDQQEGAETRSCEVVGRTGDTRSNAPSLVIGFCTVVVWTGPTRAYGRVVGYDVRFVTPGSDSEGVVVSKGNRELFHIIGDELQRTDNMLVQVRAKTESANGRWSELVPLGCDMTLGSG